MTLQFRIKRNHLFIIIYSSLISHGLSAQIERTSNSFQKDLEINESLKGMYQEEVVYTPLGPTVKSNVHFVDSRHHLNVNDRFIQIIQTNTGRVTQELDNGMINSSIFNKGNIISRYKDQSARSSSEFTDGWQTYALGYNKSDNPKPFTHFSSNFIVPSAPKNMSGQIIYLFTGVENIDTLSHIVQPVLQWGLTPAGGGNYWAICNWYALSNGHAFHDSLIKVESGTRLQGVIELTTGFENSYNYTSFFTGYSSSLQVKNLPHLTELSITLETFHINNCNEFPHDEKIRFTDIQVLTDGNYPQLFWQTNNEIPVCRQFTNVLSGDSNNGEIIIYFHRPSPIDNYNDFHVYPNPVDSWLHISPHRPVHNCKIEIYDSFGRLVKDDFYECLDYEFDLETDHYRAGIYYVKLQYYNDILKNELRKHTFRILKK